ncbi:MAG TPA: hypothetical protein VJS44_04975 [Pyrinomonadaceae bacterium]|nr:hypothetical protein [Pyrinomonadaceae bacterium]
MTEPGIGVRKRFFWTSADKSRRFGFGAYHGSERAVNNYRRRAP